MLKSIVVGLGVLIVLSVAFLVYTISTGLHKTYKLSQPTVATVDTVSANPQTAIALPLFGDQRYPAPVDYTLNGVMIDAGRIVVEYQHKTEQSILLVLYSLQGVRLGSLAFAG